MGGLGSGRPSGSGRCRVANHRHGSPDWSKSVTDNSGAVTETEIRQRTLPELAELCGVSVDDITLARRIKASSPELAEKVWKGTMSLEEAARGCQ
jgi:hypothetical protein